MKNSLIDQNYRTSAILIERIRQKQDAIHEWLNSQEIKHELPLYSSVDIRDAGFKAAVVDTNIFPAGFNNLCEHGLADSIELIRKAILRRVPDGKNILIVAEEHTRNTWYLENVRILEDIIRKAGFDVKIATFLEVQPLFCENTNYVELETATGYPVKIYCLRKILSRYETHDEKIDMIILNNDLTKGIPQTLLHSDIPIYPSIQAGWHSRLKSNHFSFTAKLVDELARILDVDPWFFSCLFTTVDNANINKETDRANLADRASRLLESITKKYAEHKITEKPYLLLKSDSGTYGMGVLPVEDPKDILNLNRKRRNNLYKGKSAQLITKFILQEGVPTIYNIDHQVSEVCIYQIENNLIGGFYRSHAGKSDRDNLNSRGMVFKKMCPHLSKYGECGVHHDVNIFDLYRIWARIAAIAAHREIEQLETRVKTIDHRP